MIDVLYITYDEISMGGCMALTPFFPVGRGHRQGGVEHPPVGPGTDNVFNPQTLEALPHVRRARPGPGPHKAGKENVNPQAPIKMYSIPRMSRKMNPTPVQGYLAHKKQRPPRALQ